MKRHVEKRQDALFSASTDCLPTGRVYRVTMATLLKQCNNSIMPKSPHPKRLRFSNTNAMQSIHLLFLNVAVSSQHLLLELLRILVPQLGRLSIQWRRAFHTSISLRTHSNEWKYQMVSLTCWARQADSAGSGGRSGCCMRLTTCP
jgi:hypothetical protein